MSALIQFNIKPIAGLYKVLRLLYKSYLNYLNYLNEYDNTSESIDLFTIQNMYLIICLIPIC